MCWVFVTSNSAFQRQWAWVPVQSSAADGRWIQEKRCIRLNGTTEHRSSSDSYRKSFQIPVSSLKPVLVLMWVLRLQILDRVAFYLFTVPPFKAKKGCFTAEICCCLSNSSSKQNLENELVTGRELVTAAHRHWQCRDYSCAAAVETQDPQYYKYYFILTPTQDWTSAIVSKGGTSTARIYIFFPFTQTLSSIEV